MAARLMEFVSHIQFPVRFDSEKLKSDLDLLLSSDWVSHFNHGVYSGNWTSVSLMSKGGKSSDIFAHSANDLAVEATELLKQTPYFQEVISSFHCEVLSARLLCLSAGSEIKPHKDHCLNYLDGEFRVHIPIRTNADVAFYLAGERLKMPEGTCWYIDANEEHSVSNQGKEDRIHLVIDFKRNDWSDAFFFREVNEQQLCKARPPIDETRKLQLIAELRKMNTPASEALIAQLLNGA